MLRLEYYGDIIFKLDEREMLRLCRSGDIYVKGEKTTRDIDVYKGLYEWLDIARPKVEVNTEDTDEREGEQEQDKKPPSIPRYVG